MTVTLRCSLWPFLIAALSCAMAETHEPIRSQDTVSPAPAMTTARSGHTATLLPNGRVMIAGGMNGNGSYFEGVEIFDPSTNVFTAARNMSARRVGHSATLLPNGKVLIAGGFNGNYLQNTELYDPATGVFTAVGPLIAPRSGHVATLLTNGKVLLVGGVGAGYTFLSSAELYDPATGRFTATGSMAEPREGHTATLLNDGKVLVAGGHKDRREAMTVFASAELYDPVTGKFMRTGDMTVVRHKHAAALLPDGDVLIVGGSDKRDWRGQYATAEIYDSSRGTFKPAPRLNASRFKLASAMVTMRDGRVLIAGGASRVEIYDRTRNAFSIASGELDTARFFSSATLLNDGRVLIAGGYDDGIAATAKTWLYAR